MRRIKANYMICWTQCQGKGRRTLSQNVLRISGHGGQRVHWSPGPEERDTYGTDPRRDVGLGPRKSPLELSSMGDTCELPGSHAISRITYKQTQHLQPQRQPISSSPLQGLTQYQGQCSCAFLLQSCPWQQDLSPPTAIFREREISKHTIETRSNFLYHSW